MLKLSTNGSPLFFAIHYSVRNINRIIDKTKPIVGHFVFKVISILMTKINNVLNDAFIAVHQHRNLDRVRLDVDDGITELLNDLLKFDHEQRTSLSYDVVVVSWISESVW